MGICCKMNTEMSLTAYGNQDESLKSSNYSLKVLSCKHVLAATLTPHNQHNGMVILRHNVRFQ